MSRESGGEVTRCDSTCPSRETTLREVGGPGPVVPVWEPQVCRPTGTRSVNRRDTEVETYIEIYYYLGDVTDKIE